MRKFLQLLVSNSMLVTLFIVIFSLGGIFALRHLPVGLFPGLDIPVVNVISHYPGTTSEDMELLITRPIEDSLRTISGVQRVSSTSVEGISQITVQFEWGTRITDARQLVQSKLLSVQNILPSGITPRLENIGTTLQEVAGYIVYGGGDQIDLHTTVQFNFVSRLMSVEGVSRVEVLGGDKPAFVVSINPEDLMKEHLTIKNIKIALEKYNKVSTLDYINRGSREYIIRGNSRLQTIQDILSVPVVDDGSKTICLKDIATVKHGHIPKHYTVHGNGLPAVSFVVFKQPNANTINVVRGIDNKLDELRELLPQSSKIRKFYDQSDIVIEARNSLFHDLIFGILLAVGVLFLFMGTVRTTLIVSASIPITLLVTLALMKLFNETLNVITLSALTLAVGMVVDDAIVVAENIVRHIHTTKNQLSASIIGTIEITSPNASGTFTTVAAFAPLLFISGIAGLFVRPFGLVITIALLTSLIASITFVPMMFSHIGPISKRKTYGSRILEHIEAILQKTLKLAFCHRRITILLSIVTLGFGGLAILLGPIRVLPPIDEGALLIEYVMPPGTSLKESNRIGNILENIALAQSDIETVQRRTGSPTNGFQIEGVNRGELVMKLIPHTKRQYTVQQIFKQLRACYSKIPGVAVLYHQPTQEKMDESLSGLPAVFGVTIFGPDMNKLVGLASEVEKLMSKDFAITNIVNNTKIKSPQIIVKPRPIELACHGLSPSDVFETIKADRLGVQATTIINQNQQVQILIKNNIPTDGSINSLKNIHVTTPFGQVITLQNIADIKISHLPAAVTRLNGEREITVLAEIDGDISSTIRRLKKKFKSIPLPDKYSIAFTGQYQVIKKTILDFAILALAAVLLIYLIMAMQFHSFLQPIIILVTIPFALVGAIMLLAITRVGLDISVGMGILTLIGIAVNNAIVLLDYTNKQINNGESISNALHKATSIRLRPILLTAITTIFAMIPVAVNPAVGSRIFQPFGITVIGGLMSSTIATLILVPVLRTFLSHQWR